MLMGGIEWWCEPGCILENSRLGWSFLKIVFNRDDYLIKPFFLSVRRVEVATLTRTFLPSTIKVFF